MSNHRPTEQERYTYRWLFASSSFGSSMLAGGLHAIQIFMFIYGVSVFFETSKERRKGRLRFVIISFIILVTSSIDVIFDMWRVFRVLFAGGQAEGNYIAVFSDDWLRYNRVIVAGDSLLAITIAVGDILMLWRCFILWKHKKWVVILPSLACIASIICNIIYLLPERTLEGVEIDALKASVASVALSVAMNIMITLLILLQLIAARLELSSSLPERKVPRLYSTVTTILIESAAPLAFFGICRIIFTTISSISPPKNLITHGKLQASTEVFGTLYYAFCALSPQMIIFRVTTGRSWKNAQDSERGAASFSRPIDFAPGMSEQIGSADSNCV